MVAFPQQTHQKRDIGGHPVFILRPLRALTSCLFDGGVVTGEDTNHSKPSFISSTRSAAMITILILKIKKKGGGGGGL